MIEKIAEELYRIQIPLPNNPLKFLNSYVISADEFLIIDTGFNLDLCYEEMLKGLKEIGVELSKAEIFVTHLHADHIGLAGRLGGEVYISQIDAEIAVDSVIHPEHWEELAKFYFKNGFPQNEAEKVSKIHPAVKYAPKAVQFNFLDDGDLLEFGNYVLEVIHTPGHTPGHLCLYEPDKKILFSGDHILFDITPNITHWDTLEDALGDYLGSLDKVYELEVKVTLPGHRNFYGSHRNRIEELREHHKRRLEEALNAVKNGSRTAWEIAQHITWDLKYERWEELPTMQKWFAVGETIAHLDYLERRGKIKKENSDKIYYSA
ncbi:MAG: MBL fold metallo-hydrolase [Archaeoglobaceae archaeon]|nr:MBL fold metallo-hydrolase [Archaeoglobaceae archaeon]MDW8117924.1 MBL fold metallo-hydrolase [Archaeoglobaceae archaeon]